ncbi:MAG TPA: monovalent cation/H(+) antiporter subunit G [Mycobacteriales bacterium]|nr:monovalent cation/H(+) antiporter subunit G [Mycobacteriales bacterium]
MTRDVISDALLAAALLVILLSGVGALTMRTTFGKLHYLTPVTSVAGPLFAAAIVVHTGWGITAGLQLLIVALLGVTGPILQMATGRVEAQQRGILDPTSPP